MIGFDPFELLMSSEPEFELRQKRAIGPAGRFSAQPAYIVPARQFKSLGVHSDFGVVINSATTRDTLEITWDCPKGPVYHQEIPFMVVGEVPQPPAPRGPARGVRKGLSARRGRTKR